MSSDDEWVERSIPPSAVNEDDYFGSFGVQRKVVQRKEKARADPEKSMGQSSRELNKAYWQGGRDNTGEAPQTSQNTPHASGEATHRSRHDTHASSLARPSQPRPGSSWRMSRLKRTYEVAAQERRPLEEVALERYGSLDAFREAVEERAELDGNRRGSRADRGVGGAPAIPAPPHANTLHANTPHANTPHANTLHANTPHANAPSRKYVYTDTPRSSGAFKRPGAELAGPGAATARPAPSSTVPDSRSPAAPTTSKPLLSHAAPTATPEELNKLQAKVLKAKLMGRPEAGKLEAEYERLKRGAVEVLPGVDSRGRLYDVGASSADNNAKGGPPPKRARTNAPTPGSPSIADLLREERTNTGTNADREYADRIARDSRFEAGLDYIDDTSENLAQGAFRDASKKRLFAINDHRRTQRALASCTLCYGERGEAPRTPVVALGTRAYLALPETSELVPGQCRIVPLQHHLSLLEADEDTWEEVRNFMKTVIQMCDARGEGVVFCETVLNLQSQRHTCLECFPVKYDVFDVLPGYFRESIDTSEAEWSQHRKRIEFSRARPFRRALVPNLPYFAVLFDSRGEKGLGHVIEGVDDAPERDLDGDLLQAEVSQARQFPAYFAAEIIGGVLELEPRQWRKPRRVDLGRSKERVGLFRKEYARYDWTTQLGGGE